jgi:MFS family permease
MNNVKKLKIIGFLSQLYFYTPIFTLFLIRYGVNLETIIFAQILYSVGSLLGEIPTGYFADKFGNKQAIVFGLLLDALGMLILFVSPGLAALIISFIIRGVSGAFLSGSTEALLFESHRAEAKVGGETYQQAFGRYLANGILAFIIATLVAGVGVQLFGASSYRPIILLTAFATISALAVAVSLKNLKSSDLNDAAELQFLKHSKESLAIVKSERTVRALTIVALLTISAEYFLRQSYQPLFQSAGVIPIFLGLSLSIGSALNYIIVRRSYLLEKYLTLDKILLLHNLLMAAGFGLLALFTNPYILVGAYILLQGLFNAQRPIVSDYINERIDSSKRATVLSTISFGQSLMSIITRLLLAASLGLFGLQQTLGLQALYLIVGIGIGYWYMRRCGCVHRINNHDEQQCIEDCPEALGAPQQI